MLISCPAVISVAETLTDLATTCQEMNQLVQTIALPRLATRVHRSAWESSGVNSDPSGGLSPIWNQILTDPTSCKVADLKVGFLPPIKFNI